MQVSVLVQNILNWFWVPQKVVKSVFCSSEFGHVEVKLVRFLSASQLVTVIRTVRRMAGCATATATRRWARWRASAAARPTWRGHAATSAGPDSSA